MGIFEDGFAERSFRRSVVRSIDEGAYGNGKC